jgi:(p)ppGpp synthase/HD superfamily hydrolase
MRFAATAHNGQRVPGSELPYLMHLSLVAMEVIAALGQETGRNENLAVQCALLHDVVEDTETPLAELEREFGTAVAQGVSTLTKDKSLPKADRMSDSLRRIRTQPREVWMVKLADRITNLQPPPGEWTPDKVVAYREEAEEILAALGEASPFLARRLRQKLQTYGVIR